MRWLVVAACVLVACKGKQQPAPKRDDARVQPADAAVADAAIDAATPDAATLDTTITPKGVGPIRAKWIEEDDYQKAFPGLTTKHEHQEGEDFMYDEIVLLRDDTRLLRAVITDRSLFKVEVYDPMFATGAGVKVGMTVGELAAKMKGVECTFATFDPESDAERVDRALRCEDKSLPHVMFEIDHAGFKGKDGEVSAKTIATREIVQIVWLAPQE